MSLTAGVKEMRHSRYSPCLRWRQRINIWCRRRSRHDDERGDAARGLSAADGAAVAMVSISATTDAALLATATKAANSLVSPEPDLCVPWARSSVVTAEMLAHRTAVAQRAHVGFSSALPLGANGVAWLARAGELQIGERLSGSSRTRLTSISIAVAPTPATKIIWSRRRTLSYAKADVDLRLRHQGQPASAI